MRTAVGAVLLAAASLLLAGCVGTGTAVTTRTVAVTATVTATVTAAPEASIPGLPAELIGSWCSDDGSSCFDPAQVLADNPYTFVEDSAPDADLAGARRVLLCLVPFGDAGACSSQADERLYEYLPAGVAWDCPAVAKTWGNGSLSTCDPDYSTQHDTSVPRLLDLYIDQQGPAFTDVPPMYLQG